MRGLGQVMFLVTKGGRQKQEKKKDKGEEHRQKKT